MDNCKVDLLHLSIISVIHNIQSINIMISKTNIGASADGQADPSRRLEHISHRWLCYISISNFTDLTGAVIECTYINSPDTLLCRF